MTSFPLKIQKNQNYEKFGFILKNSKNFLERNGEIYFCLKIRLFTKKKFKNVHVRM